MIENVTITTLGNRFYIFLLKNQAKTVVGGQLSEITGTYSASAAFFFLVFFCFSGSAGTACAAASSIQSPSVTFA